MGDIGSSGPPGPPSIGLTADTMIRLFSTTAEMRSSFHGPFHPSYGRSEVTNPIETATKFFDDLKRIANEITLQSKPDGSRQYPARSCRDIADYYPEKSNGFYIFLLSIRSTKHFLRVVRLGLYYIDPNEGSRDDAVLVYCHLTERLTCVNASQTSIHIDRLMNKKFNYGQHIRLMNDLLQQNEVIE